MAGTLFIEINFQRLDSVALQLLQLGVEMFCRSPMLGFAFYQVINI